MDNAQKAIMIGVGLFITIIIISSVLLITNMGTDIIDSAAGEVGLMTETLQREMIKQYDGKTLTYRQMLDCVEKYISSSTVSVQVKVGSTTLNYGPIKMTVPTGATAVDYKVGGIVISTTAKNNKPNTYKDANDNLTSVNTYKTAIAYNTAGEMIGIVAIAQ